MQLLGFLLPGGKMEEQDVGLGVGIFPVGVPGPHRPLSMSHDMPVSG